MRIDKFLSALKYTTRRQVKKYLKTHQVIYLNQRILDASFDINPEDDIYIDKEKVYYKSSIHVMIHKPRGYICSKKDELYPSVLNLLKEPYSRFDFHIAGRLDVDTTGILILSTDGAFIHTLTHPKKHMNKVYEAVLNKPFVHEKQLREGVYVFDDQKREYFAKALNVLVDGNKVDITIDEGKYHQVKRMFLALDYKVLQLKRKSIGHLHLKNLNEGEYIEIEKEDVYD